MQAHAPHTHTHLRKHAQMSVLQSQNEAQAEELMKYQEIILQARHEWSLVHQSNVAKTEEIRRLETQVFP
jgi:hypothetical protein